MTTSQSPFHRGETYLQDREGVAERMAQIGHRVILDHLPPQHRHFYPQLRFAVLGSVDEAGMPWATLVAGPPGFIRCPDETQLTLKPLRAPGDPVLDALEPGSALALLGIQLETRRRNRANGVVQALEDGLITLRVDQAFGNCPRFIQQRHMRHAPTPPPSPAVVEQLSALNDGARAAIRAADTFFVASFVEDGGPKQVDVSHRGGRPGFVQIDDQDTLMIPDFSGNLYFNTLGNLLVNPLAGLVFPDFANGDMLHLSGRTEVLLESSDIAAFHGAERLWLFHPQRIIRRPAAFPLRSPARETGWSPFTLRTGNWDHYGK